MDRNDQSAIRAVLSGDRDAYKAMVLRHSAMVFRVAFRITGNEADAEEVVQEAFLRSYQSLDQFHFQSAYASWLYRIAVNCAYNVMNRRRHDPNRMPEFRKSVEEAEDRRDELPDTAAGPERLLLSREMAARQQHALHSLTALERTAFQLRHIEDQSTNEIAAALNIAPSAAKQAVFRAVQKLRLRLAPLRERS
jgi:RNA polymerase sigma-70 factor (ECF subfamily)